MHYYPTRDRQLKLNHNYLIIQETSTRFILPYKLDQREAGADDLQPVVRKIPSLPVEVLTDGALWV